jgi:hypothetical protein
LGEKDNFLEKLFPFPPKPPIPFQKLFFRFSSGGSPEENRDLKIKGAGHLLCRCLRKARALKWKFIFSVF